jgi:hypothetical protein
MESPGLLGSKSRPREAGGIDRAGRPSSTPSFGTKRGTGLICNVPIGRSDGQRREPQVCPGNISTIEHNRGRASNIMRIYRWRSSVATLIEIQTKRVLLAHVYRVHDFEGACSMLIRARQTGQSRRRDSFPTYLLHTMYYVYRPREPKLVGNAACSSWRGTFVAQSCNRTQAPVPVDSVVLFSGNL